MKIYKIIPDYNNNIQFQGNKIHSTEDWINLRDALTQCDQICQRHEKAVMETDNLPSFKKQHFEYVDYINLSKRERLIINLLNKIGTQKLSITRKNTSINKDAERIMHIASIIKEHLDGKYKKGYRLVGIGNTPAPIIEAMQLLGADAITIPFSRTILELSNCREFPYEHIIPDSDYNGYPKKFEKYNVNDWENYFKFFGLDKNFHKRTDKTLIFTDMIADGTTFEIFKTILKELGIKKHVEFIPLGKKLLGNIKLDYDLDKCFEFSVFKCYARIPSPKNYFWKADIIKHPEYINSLNETFISKLFRCALFDLLSKIKK